MLPALPLMTDLAVLLLLSDRTEARVRWPGSVPAAASLDIETVPAARLTLALPRLRGALAYTPRLTQWDAGSNRASLVALHEGAVGVEWFNRQVRLSLGQAASYGGVNLATLAPASATPGAPARVDAVPGSQVLDYAASTTTLSSRLELRRWAASLAIGYQLGGGATAAARPALPFQQGPFGEATLTRALRRTDFLYTSAAAAEASFSSGPESLLVEVTGGWRRQWTRSTETRLALGASEARTRAGAREPHQQQTYPVAEGVVERRMATDDGRLDLRASVRLGPFVNRLVGLVDERVQGTVTVSQTHARFGARASVSGAQSVPTGGAASIRLVSGELGASYGTSDRLTLDAGVRGIWQRQEQPSLDLKQATFFVGATLRAPATKL